VCGLFSGSLPWPSAREIQEGVDAEKAIRDSKPRTQWPKGDYVNFAYDFARTIGIPLPTDIPVFNKRSVRAQDIFVPQHFIPPPSLRRQCALGDPPVLASLELTLAQSASSALFVAAAVFRSLHGRWIVNRSYTSRYPGYPSGPSTGTAEFTLRSAAQEQSQGNELCQKEYLYSEKTELTSSTGDALSGTQHYIYRYDEANDKLGVFFTNRDEALSLGNLFHKVDFEVPPEEEGSPQTSRREKSPWSAKASHFCSPDSYEVAYVFCFRGADLREWKVEYEVKGPKKDYSIETWYTRPENVRSP